MTTHRSTAVDKTRGSCPKCGQVHERCVGHKRDGSPCRRWPRRGTTVCPKHGGDAPQVKAKAAVNVALSKAERAVMALDPSARSGDWIDALERVLSRQESMEDYLRQRVEEIAPESWRQLDAKDAEQLHALVDAYRVVLRDLRDTAAKIGALDLDSIRVRIEAGRTEALTDRMVRSVEAYRSAAGVDDAAHQAGLAAMAKVMRS